MSNASRAEAPPLARTESRCIHRTAALKSEMQSTFEKKAAEKAESDKQKQVDAKLEASAKVIESLVALFEKFHKNAAISAIISQDTADELAAIRSTHEALKTTLVPPA